ncbi:hypothetical protein A4A49_13885 [Nicotiana attenuata]|uniref:Uncharacterized protein n=1 Tax=Nicotiana attenuata TaxID=49451 RepID=A0A1J6I2M5_NICAT|nr:hypothetical protein A4A49_13885 [Nicotiana attenuata]
MPGVSSHLSTNGLKYGIQQFKPVPTGSTSGLGTFTSLTSYAVNTSGVIGSTTGVEDSSRLKYKDTNFYVPNPQVSIFIPFTLTIENQLFFHVISCIQHSNHTIEKPLPCRLKCQYNAK